MLLVREIPWFGLRTVSLARSFANLGFRSSLDLGNVSVGVPASMRGDCTQAEALLIKRFMFTRQNDNGKGTKPSRDIRVQRL